MLTTVGSADFVERQPVVKMKPLLATVAKLGAPPTGLSLRKRFVSSSPANLSKTVTRMIPASIDNHKTFGVKATKGYALQKQLVFHRQDNKLEVDPLCQVKKSADDLTSKALEDNNETFGDFGHTLGEDTQDASFELWYKPFDMEAWPIIQMV